jgi:hypothetical protein
MVVFLTMLLVELTLITEFLSLVMVLKVTKTTGELRILGVQVGEKMVTSELLMLLVLEYVVSTWLLSILPPTEVIINP